jgi:hypothetical protein
MNAHTPTPSIEEARRFLELLDAPDAVHDFVALGPDGAKDITSIQHIRGTVDVVWPELVTLNLSNPPHGIYLASQAMDGAGRKAANVSRRRAVFAELDDGLPDKPWPLAPSMLVSSSPGKHHAWWRVEGLSSPEFRGVERRMVASWKSDKGVIDEARVLRLPGTLHQKDLARPHMVRLVEGAGEQYTPAEIRAAFPPVDAGDMQRVTAWVSGVSEDYEDRISPQLRARINEQGGDRSKHSFAVMRGLMDAGLTDDEVYEVSDGAVFALKWLERGDLEEEISRVRARWKPPSHGLTTITPGGFTADVPQVKFPDLTDKGTPVTKSTRNVLALLGALGVELRFNEFTNVIEWRRGESAFAELSERAFNWLYAAAGQARLSISTDALVRLLGVIADANEHHPVTAYLGGLTWDGVRRLDTWTTHYLGADDTPLNRAFGRVTLIGAVHRVRVPGSKHDTMMVLEGPQGGLKSTAVKTLGGPFYADGLRLGLTAKETVEATAGAWIIEVGELSGMSNREVEAVKDQLSRGTDRARLAYGRLTSTVRRQWIAIGTTNASTYLRDATGNRRFLPVKVGKVDIAALQRDRDQLWAEAARAEREETLWHGAPVGIPAELWAAAAAAQEARRATDPLEDQMVEWFGDLSGFVEKEYIWRALGRLEVVDRTQREANVMTAAMAKMGWTPDRQRHPRSGKPVQCYKKLVQGMPQEWLELWLGEFGTAQPHSPPESGFTPIVQGQP